MKNAPFFPHHEGSSFFDFLHRHYGHMAPLSIPESSFPQNTISPEPWPPPPPAIPYGTTVLAIKYQGGVVIAGDRRATEGFQIADRRIEKVFKIDEYSAMAIAGAAGPCIEMARLFQTELEHYEKLEGVPLSAEGKANKLGQMVKANLPMVFQGLVVMPLYVGYDVRRAEGRIFKYDITGGRYEESEYYAIGSGGKDARNTIREHYRVGLSEEEALKIGLLALYNAADEDVGTGGPDLIRGIYPTAKLASAAGVVDVTDERIRAVYDTMMAGRGKGK
jgi:proteasome beta subunit